ncbi:MAG TPA: response regulator [Chloroflexota bacterium]|nr:response regulator [Chloroflexota bacterium]
MDAIVVAEDDPILRHLMQDALTEFGVWLVCTVGDGRALLETLTCLVPTLVVLDVQMPRLDGITAYRRLRQREETRTVPVLFVTSAPRMVWEAGLEGPFEVLVKPFDLDALEERVSRLVVSDST